MIGQFFRNAVFRVGLNVLVKGVYLFAVDRAVQNLLPEGDYGLYFALLGFAMLLQVLADFGLQLYNARELAGHRYLLAKYFPYFIGLKLLLGLLFIVLLTVLGLFLGYRSGGAVELLLLAGGIQFFNSLVLYLRSNLAGLGKYALEGWFSVADKAFVILTVGALLLLAPQELTIHRFAALQLTGWVLTALGLVAVVGDRLPRKLPRFRRATFVLLLRGGAPFALAVFLATAYTRTDAVMIERLLADGAAAAGHYAAGYRLLDALNMFGWLLAGLLIPMYARLHKQGEDLRPLLRFSGHLLLVGGVLAAVPLAAYSQEIVNLLYDFAEPRTAWILFFLLLSFVAQCLNYVYGSLLSATGFIGRMNKIYAVGILLNVGGNLLLLPRYGAPGAAFVTLVTQAFVAVVQAVLARRWLGLGGRTLAWGRLLAFSSLLCTCALACWYLNWPWVLSVALLGGLGLLFASVLGLLRWSALLRFGGSVR